MRASSKACELRNKQGYAILAMRDALTKEQLLVHVYVQVITFEKSILFWVRWDQVWGAGGHCDVSG
jgi:hypothetical protein